MYGADAQGGEEDDTAVTHSSGRRWEGCPRLSLVYEMRFWDEFEEEEGGDRGRYGMDPLLELVFCVHFLFVCLFVLHDIFAFVLIPALRHSATATIRRRGNEGVEGSSDKCSECAEQPRGECSQ